jgi:hypothetical protein
MKFEIFDNFLTREEEDEIENIFLKPGRDGNDPLEFHLKQDPTSPGCYSLAHILIIDNTFATQSDQNFGNFFLSTIVNKIPELVFNNSKFNHLIGKQPYIHVMRAFVQLPNQSTAEYKDAHVDLRDNDNNPYPHTVALYYVNDSDGDTVFFDKDKETIIHRVPPKKGRLLLFDGTIFHGAGVPKKNVRAVINIDIVT